MSQSALYTFFYLLNHLFQQSIIQYYVLCLIAVLHFLNFMLSFCFIPNYCFYSLCFLFNAFIIFLLSLPPKHVKHLGWPYVESVL